ncbi:DUF2889 domain-containing protein [Variovorax brevis]|uniref:DUF2889 domain-containing protein n=1 Tax=Variovorax brevis TaxID=3053503 RepID=UPI003365987B
MCGYRRSDGLYEVEGRLVDRKPYDMPMRNGGRVVPANEPIHDLGVRLVFDKEMTVQEVSTFTEAAPYAECPAGGEALKSLIGLRIASGWGREVRARLKGAPSCTHLLELLVPLGTTAFQSLGVVVFAEPEARDPSGRPLKIDSCYAYRATGELVLRQWPTFHIHSVQSSDE